jgi:hypothetical protein
MRSSHGSTAKCILSLRFSGVQIERNERDSLGFLGVELTLSPLFHVEMTSTPGAKAPRVAPKLLKLAMESVESEAPTAKALGSSAGLD